MVPASVEFVNKEIDIYEILDVFFARFVCILIEFFNALFPYLKRYGLFAISFLLICFLYVGIPLLSCGISTWWYAT